MNTLTIVGLAALLTLLVIVVIVMGLAALDKPQDWDDERIDAMFDRIDKESRLGH